MYNSTITSTTNKKYSSAKKAENIVNKAKEMAGFTKTATIHNLRHAFAKHLLDAGYDIRYVQKLLGHKNIKKTQIYTHVNSESIKKIKSPIANLNIKRCTP